MKHDHLLFIKLGLPRVAAGHEPARHYSPGVWENEADEIVRCSHYVHAHAQTVTNVGAEMLPSQCPPLGIPECLKLFLCPTPPSKQLLGVCFSLREGGMSLVDSSQGNSLSTPLKVSLISQRDFIVLLCPSNQVIMLVIRLPRCSVSV